MATYLTTKNQPLRRINYGRESWPPRVYHDEVVELRVGDKIYGGGQIFGPLTPAEVAAITAAGYTALLINN